MPFLGESFLIWLYLSWQRAVRLRACQNCIRLPNSGSNVGQGVGAELSLGWAETSWSTERTKQLSAINRQERAGPDKRGEVYHELNSTKEETPGRRHPHFLLLPRLPSSLSTVEKWP